MTNQPQTELDEILDGIDRAIEIRVLREPLTEDAWMVEMRLSLKKAVTTEAKQAILAHQEQAVREARIDENRKAYAEVSKRYRGFRTRSSYQSVKYKSEGVGIMLKTGQAQKLLDMRLAKLTSKESEDA